MQLQYAGQQDYWTTDEPHMSYFLSTYRRYTPTGIVLTDIPIRNEFKFGNTLSVQIPRRCDLLGRISLTVQFNEPPYIRDNISGLIEYAELVIGGRVINKVRGQYIFIRNQLDTSIDDNAIKYYTSQSTGHKFMTAEERALYDTYSLEIPFYFSQHPSLYIPICALGKQNIEVRIKLSEYDKYSSTRGLFYLPISRDSIKFGFLTMNEVYISEFERNILKSRNLEYPITQIQEHIVRLKEGELKKTIPLDFKNMVKEIYFFGELGDLPYNYTEVGFGGDPVPSTGFYFRHISNFELKLNGITHINRDGDYFVYEQPYKHHKSRANLHDPFSSNSRLNFAINNSEFGMYSFTPTQSILNPVGCLNMSRIIDQSCTIEFVDKLLVNVPPPFPTGGTSADIQEVQDFPNTKTTVHIYALSYNILVIRDNICGLKY